MSFIPTSNIYSYSLCYKEYGLDWETYGNSSKVDSSAINNSTGSNKIITIAEGLNPGSTYNVRLLAHDINGDVQGDPGPELIIDTETVSCTPKSRCIVM